MGQDNSPSNAHPDIPEPNPAYVQRLKRVVITLGVFLIVGMMALVVGLVVKSKKTRIALPPGGFSLDAKLAADTQVLSSQLVGDRLWVHVKGTSGEQIILFDVKKGIEIGRIKLR